MTCLALEQGLHHGRCHGKDAADARERRARLNGSYNAVRQLAQPPLNAAREDGTNHHVGHGMSLAASSSIAVRIDGVQWRRDQ
jgi:hypothetical protein